MKIDFSTPIKDFDGKPMVENLSARAKDEIGKLSVETRAELGNRLDDKNVTLASLTLTIARATFRDEGELSEATKTTRFQLGMKAALGGEQTLSNEEHQELRKMIVRGFDSLISIRGAEIIDAAKAEPQEATKAA